MKFLNSSRLSWINIILDIIYILSSLISNGQSVRTDGNNDYPFAPQQAKAVINWKRFSRFNLNSTEWIWWGPRFRQRAGVLGEWDDDFMRHGFRSFVPGMNYRGTGQAENERDLLQPGDRMMGYILMPGDPGQMPDYLRNAFNSLPDSDPRKNQIAQYIHRLIPVTDPDAARLMGQWMGVVIRDQICGGKIPKWVTIDEESAHYWEHPEGEASLRKFVGYMYLGILDVCTGSRIYTYGPKPLHSPWYGGFADKGRLIDGKIFTEHPKYAPNYWWSTGNGLDTNSPLAQALRMNGGGVAAGDHYWRSTIGMGTIYQKNADGSYVLQNGRRLLRTDNSTTILFGQTVTIYGSDPNYYNQNEYEFWCNWLYEDLAGEESNRYWMNGQKYALRRYDRSPDFTGVGLGDWYRTHTEEANAPGKGDSRPLNPQALEMGAIFRTLLHDVEFLWHGEYYQRGPTTHDNNRIAYPGQTAVQGGYKTSLGQYEFIVKGLQRFAEFDQIDWGNFYYVRPIRGVGANPDKWREPCIRGRISEGSNYLLLAAAWPIHDPSDQTFVTSWVDTGTWKGGTFSFTIDGRNTYLSGAKIPGVPPGVQVLPQHLRFRFKTLYGETVTVTGDYNYSASNSETIP